MKCQSLCSGKKYFICRLLIFYPACSTLLFSDNSSRRGYSIFYNIVITKGNLYYVTQDKYDLVISTTIVVSPFVCPILTISAVPRKIPDQTAHA